jgi:hypothetical protein
MLRVTGAAMKNGMYAVITKGYDGVDWPPGGVCFLRDGVVWGGGAFSYWIGSYTSKEGILKGQSLLNLHTPPPVGHVYYNAKDVGVGFVGTYEGDEAEMTCTANVGKRSLSLQVILRKLADIA